LVPTPASAFLRDLFLTVCLFTRIPVVALVRVGFLIIFQYPIPILPGVAYWAWVVDIDIGRPIPRDHPIYPAFPFFLSAYPMA
jgi:hypothetical protein